MKVFFKFWVCLLFVFGALFPVFGQSFRMISDLGNPGELKVVSISSGQKIRQAVSEQATMEVILTPLKTETSIDIILRLDSQFPFEKLFLIAVEVWRVCEGGNCNGSVLADSYLSGKAINRTDNSLKLTMNGLAPGQSYEVKAYFSGLEGDPCAGNLMLSKVVRTAASTGRPGKMLLIVNEEWKDDMEIRGALDQYEADIKREDPGYKIERYYIGTDSGEKWRLHQYIVDQYEKSDLSHLFFIGDNAAITQEMRYYDYQGKIVNIIQGPMFAPYTTIFYYWDHFDRATGHLIFNRYQDACFVSDNELRRPVYQHRNTALSMGMVLPGREVGNKEKISYITEYFTKLHGFREGKITFEKTLLFTDGFVDESTVLEAVKANPDWGAAEALPIGRPRYPDISDPDAVWQSNLREKLSSKSYRGFFVNVHGQPDYHAFGVSTNDVLQFPRLDVQLIDLVSCSVGDFSYPNYLAAAYLKKGSVLNVRAYTLPVAVGRVGENSYFMSYLWNDGVLEQFQKGHGVADAYRLARHYINIEMIFGDPLVPLFNDLNPGSNEKEFVYPNPAEDYIRLNTPLLRNATGVSLYAVSGQMVFNSTSFPEGKIYVGGVSPGIYLMKVVVADGTSKVFKILIFR